MADDGKIGCLEGFVNGIRDGRIDLPDGVTDGSIEVLLIKCVGWRVTSWTGVAVNNCDGNVAVGNKVG